MLAVLLAFAQAATAGPPDIQFHATVDVRSAKVESRGRSSVRAWAEPDGGSQTRSSGTVTSRRFELHIDARIAAPALEETAPPEPR